MIGLWLSLFKFFNKIGNYFYIKHINAVRKKYGSR